MRNIDLTQVKEAEEFETLPAGGYVVKILNVEDETSKEYLKIFFDIEVGNFKGYYQRLYDNLNFWIGSCFRSYKEKALPFFKSFITAVEKSNPGYKWNSDETALVGKRMGVVLQEEEYISTAGDLKTRLIVQEIRSVSSIQNKDFKIKPKKMLAPQQTLNNFNDKFYNMSNEDIQREFDNATNAFDITDDDIQF